MHPSATSALLVLSIRAFVLSLFINLYQNSFPSHFVPLYISSDAPPVVDPVYLFRSLTALAACPNIHLIPVCPTVFTSDETRRSLSMCSSSIACTANISRPIDAGAHISCALVVYPDLPTVVFQEAIQSRRYPI